MLEQLDHEVVVRRNRGVRAKPWRAALEQKLVAEDIGIGRDVAREVCTAIEDYLERETAGVGRYVNELEEHSPFKT